MSACERRRGVMVPMAEFRRSTGGITVVTECDGVRVALRMRHDVGDLCWYDADDDGWEPRQVEPDREGVRDYGGAVVGPLLDWWPTAGVPLPVAAGGPLLVCYADGAVRRLAHMWPDGRREWGGVTHNGFACRCGGRSFAIGDGTDGLWRVMAPLAHVVTEQGIAGRHVISRPDLLPGDDPVASLAREWRVSRSAVVAALGGGA